MAAYLATPDLAEARIASVAASAADRNRDDRPLLEFRCARSLFLQNKDPRAAQWRSALTIPR